MGMRELHMTEEVIWDCTPCKFYSLLQCALEYLEKKAGDSPDPTSGYIDQVKGW